MPRESYRVDYLADICAALADYVRTERKVMIDSERGDELEIRFTLGDPDAFHTLLSARMEQRPADRLTDNGDHALVSDD